jgi:peptidoglycan biosynthesis protein MviN/MurJ (putative lipid II flippase)
MKKFAVGFYLVSIATAMLLIEFLWVTLMTFYEAPDHTFQPEKAGSSLVTQLLFPVLLVIGTVSHFRSRKN